MRFWLRLLLCLVLSGLICGCALAGKITVDPNASGSTALKASADSDARLAQKVTYEARYVPVQQILEDLTAMTGIKLYSGSRKSDWQVRSRKMNIFVKDVKVADLMNSIAHTMKFKWSRNDDLNPPTYRLVVDKKAVTAADAQKDSAHNRSEEQWQKRRGDWIDVIMKYGGMSNSQLESIYETDPMLHEFARRGVVQAIHALFTEVPETKSRYAAGQSFRISADKLSSETKHQFFYAGNELWKYLQSVGYLNGGKPQDPIGYNGVVKPDETFDIACYRLDTGSFTPSLRWGTGSVGNTAYFHIMKGERDFEIANLPRRDSDWERFRSAAHTAVLDGVDPDRAWASEDDPHAKLKADLEKEEESLYPSEPLIEHSDFEELEKTIKLKIETPKAEQNPVLIVNTYIASFQKALADATGLGIVSDSWVNIEGDKLPDQEAKLSELLEKFAKEFNYNRDKASSILEFRHRKWWKNRSNQISDDLVAAWSENTRKNGVLSLDDLASISTLVYDQAEESLKADKVLGKAGIYRQILNILDTNGNLHWLRLYSSLSPQLRALLMGQGGRWGNKAGVNGHMLTSEQWKLAQTMFDRIGTSRGDAQFLLEQVPNEKETIYQFREIDNETGEEDRKWIVTLPRYTPPQK